MSSTARRARGRNFVTRAVAALVIGITALSVTTAIAMPAAAVEAPPSGNGQFYQISGHDSSWSDGDPWTTALGVAAGANGHFSISIVVPQSWVTAGKAVKVQLYSPSTPNTTTVGNYQTDSPAIVDEIAAGSVSTSTFKLFNTTGTQIATASYPPNDTNWQTWVDFATFTPTVAGTYELQVMATSTGANGFRLRATDTAGNDGAAGSGDELRVFNTQTVMQAVVPTGSSAPSCQDYSYFVAEGTSSITIRTFDMDGSGTVTHHRSDGSTVTGTTSGATVWASDVISVSATQTGWWYTTVCVASGGNAYAFDAIGVKYGVQSAPLHPSLTVTKSDGVTSAHRGDNLTYTIHVTNTGAGAALGVKLTDALPAGLTFVSCSLGTATGTCSATGQNVTGTLTSTIAAGASVDLTVVAKVNASVVLNTVLTNTAAVDYTDVYSSNYGPATGTDTTTIVVAPPTASNESTTVSFGVTATLLPTVAAGTAALSTVRFANGTTSIVVAGQGTWTLSGANTGNGAGAVTVKFVPLATYSGIATQQSYIVTDTSGLTATGTLNVSVTPTAATDSVTTAVGVPVSIAQSVLISNDQGLTLTTFAATAGAHGTTVKNADGSVTYTPAAGFSGLDSYTYTVKDASGLTATATVNVTVTPTAANDTATTAVNVPITVAGSTSVLANDAGSLSVTTLAPITVTGGTVTFNANGTYLFTPTAEFSGVTVANYTASDGVASLTRTLTITVTPTAGTDSVTTNVGVPVSISQAALIGNDHGTSLTTFSVTQGAHGAVVKNADGSVTYTPAAGFFGTDSYTYTVKDSTGQAATATVNVTVVAHPGIDVTKTWKSGAPTKVGDPVVWTITVKNTGDVTLTNISVSDALAGATLVAPCAFSSTVSSLAPGVTLTCDVSYVATQANVDAGTVNNSATAVANSPTGGTVTDTDSNAVTITPVAGIDVTKTLKAGAPTKLGDSVTWTVTVKNTGNVTLTNVTVTDPLAGVVIPVGCAFAGPIASLPPNATVSCDVTYAVTQINVDAGSVTNSATATGTPPVGGNVTDFDSNTVTIAPAAALSVSKVKKSGTPTKAGDPVVWTVTVKNTGNVTLTNVAVTDALAGAALVTPCGFSAPIASLAPAASVSCDVSYSVTQGNVDAGSVSNSATATGKPPTGANVTGTDTNTVPIAAAAAIDVTKSLKTGTPTKAGDPVTWTVTVKNTGNVTLTNVTVTDVLAGITFTPGCVFASAITLTPGASASCDANYAVTQANVDAGAVTNSATATGKPPVGANVTDTDSNTVTIAPAAALSVSKVKKSGTPAQAGDPVVWTVTVKNTGNVTLTNVTVTDALAGATVVTPCGFSAPIASLAPSVTVSCDVSYSVTQTNVDAGSVTNSATATGKPPAGANVTGTDTNTVTITPAPAIDLTKVKKSGTPTKVGDPVVWTVTVKNTGNVTLTNVTVTDALVGATLVTPCGFSTPIPSLAPSATVSCDVSYAVTQGNVDAGGVTNSATATGTPPVGANVTDTDSNAVTIAPSAALDVTKVKKSGTPTIVGDPVVWTVTVKNTGNVTLTNVTVTDALAGATLVTPCGFSAPIASLAPTASVSCDVTYSVTQANVDAGSVTNSATATGKPPVGANVSDTDTNTVTITPAAAIDLTKVKKSGTPTKAGDPVVWTVTVKNTGNVTLTNVTVTDPLTGVVIPVGCGFASPIATLAPSASVSCDVSYTVTQANVDAGSVANSATATGKPPVGTNVADTDTNTVTITPAAAIDVTKVKKSGAPTKAGDSVVWTVTVANTGNVTLTNVTVTDALAGATLVGPCGFSTPIASLAPGATVSCDVTYAVTQANVDAGTVTNSATATGKPPVGANVTDTDANTVTITPAATVDVTKVQKSGAPTKAGDLVVWTVTVKNTGNVTLTNVTVTDALAGATLVTPCGFSAPIATLAPNTSVTCDVTYAVTQVNVDAGSVTNSATATGKPPVGANVTDSDTNSVTISPAAALDVTKVKKSGTPTKAGDPVVWTVSVANTGNVTLTNVSVLDALVGATLVAPCPFSSTVSSLAPGVTLSCDVSYAVTQANVDAGSVTNSATATGKPPVGANVSDTDANTVPIGVTPGIDVTKSLKAGAPTKAGDSVTWTVTVKNTGTVTLTNVTVTDALAGATLVAPCGFSTPIASFAPSATVSCDVTYALTQANVDAGSVTNSATATGKPPIGANVTDTDTNTVAVAPAAAIDVTKVKKSGSPAKVGDSVVWTVSVKNSGNVTLANVTVTDGLAGVTLVAPCPFSSTVSSLAPGVTLSCDVSYVVTQANVDAGSVTNSATATGKPPVGADVSDADTNTVTITPAAALQVSKVKKSGTPAKSGDPVVWTVTVMNTGNVTLTNVTVTDALAGATLVTPCGFSSPIASLAPSATVSCDVSYAVTQANVDTGAVANTATATGKPPVGANVTGTDTNTVTIAPGPAIDVTKVKKSGAPTKAGDPVTWTVAVTNTGNVTLTNVTVTDALAGVVIPSSCGFASAIATLAPNASVSCDVTYSVSQPNVDAGAVTNSVTATGKPPVGANVTDTDTNTVTITPAAAVDVTKVKKSGAPAKTGDSVVWTVTVKNTGNVTLTNVTVTDALAGASLVTPCGFSAPIATLAPNASVSCDVTYAVTQANVDAGSVVNSATATGKPPVGANVTDTDANTVTITPAAAVDVTKVKKSGTPTKAGDPVVWTVTVANTGNVTLTNVTVTDALAGATLVTPCGFSAPIASLAPSATVACDVTYSVTQVNVDAGSVTNSATATGKPPVGANVTDADSNTVTIAPAAALSVAKVKKSGTPTKAGDPVVWTVTVANTGNVTLTNVTVTDALAGATLVTPCGFSAPIASLAPTATVACDVTYSVTQANVDAGAVTNSATATGKPPVGANVSGTDTNTVTIAPAAAIDVTKVKKSGAPTKAGDPVVWTVTVANTGNVTLTNVTVTDALAGATLVTPCGFSAPIVSLAPSASVSCDVTYGVTQANVDAGSVTNSATATGKPPVGANVTDADTNTVTIAPAPAIAVTKVKKSGTPTKAGDPVVWTVVVKNSGNGTLTNVTVTDALAGATLVTPCGFSSAIASLAPTATVACDVTYSVTQANVDAGGVTNSATASGKPPVGADVTATDTNTVTITPAASIDVAKVKKSGSPTKAGDPVVWTVTVTNSGNLTLTNVTVTDALAGATLVTPCGFSTAIATMVPGATVSCDVTYAVSQANVDAGSVTNSATATGTPPVGANVTDTDTSTVTIGVISSIDVTKTWKSGTPAKAGDPVVWTVTVKNTGDVTLTGVSITDALIGAALVAPCAFSSVVPSLAPGVALSCDVTYSVTQVNVDAGGVTNSVTATGEPPVGANVTDNDSNTVPITAAPAIGVTKVKKSGNPTKAGDPVAWTVLLKNTGNVTLTNVTVTDALAGATLTPGCVFASAITLIPGASATCDVSYDVTQANVDAGGVTNSVTATGKPPVGANVTDADTNTVTIAPAPAIDVTKVKKSGTPTKAGDPVVWTVSVKNTGNVTLTDVTVTDGLVGATFTSPCGFSSPIASLAPSATVSCDVSYAVTQPNVDAGTVTNSATATGKPPVGANVADTDANTVTIAPAAAVDVTKVKKSGAPTKAGDPVVWTVTVANTGNVTLTNVTVTDALAGATLVTPCGFSAPIASLAPTASVSCDVTYSVTQVNVDAGSVTNSATATGKPPVGANVADTDTNTVTIAPAAAIDVTKVKKSGAPTKAGDPVVWTVTVTNTGNVTLTNVAVTDALAGATVVTPCGFSSPIASFAPAATFSCDVSYAVTQGNVDTGSVTNSATATGKPPVGANVTDTDTNSATIAPAAGIEVTKTVKTGAPTKVADPVTWTVSVKNTGNVTLTDVTVTDALVGASLVAPCPFSSPVSSLAPGVTLSCDVTYAVTQANVDAGGVTNSATATGKPPAGADVTDTGTNAVTISPAATLDVTKVKKSGNPTKAGDPVVWTVSVRNSGNVTLTNVTFTDALVGATLVAPCPLSSTVGSLAPGVTLSCDVSYAVTQANVDAGSVTNAATATGTPPVGADVTDTDSNTVTITPAAAIDVTKVKKSGAPAKAGDPVVWTVTVANSGNVTLTNVTVTDALSGATVVTPCGFSAPIASFAPSATVSCDVTYAVTQANVGAGSVTNSATASGKPPVGANVTDTDSNTVPIAPAPVATDNSDSTPGGTLLTRDAAHGVLPNDSGVDVTVTAFEPIDPAKGALTINPDGSYTFQPVQYFHGTVTSLYTITDAAGNTASATLSITVDDDPPLAAGEVKSVCVSDVPYLKWSMALPDGFLDQGANPLTITFINPDGDDYVISGLPLHGEMLWPGASATEPKQWPGWKQLGDGSYVETDGNFAWTRTGVDVLFKVNPETTVLVHYPPESALCANPPTADSDPTEGLSFTGTTVMGLIPFAGAFVLAGFFLVFIARRRREEERDA